MSDDNSKTPAELAEEYNAKLATERLELATYRKAIEEEFQNRTLEDPETAARAKAHVLELVPDASITLKWLIVHAESESIRKDISKWVLDIAMKVATADDADTELQNLVKSFRKSTEAPIDR